MPSRAPSRWIFPWPSWCLWKTRAMGWSPSSRAAGVGMVPLWWGDTLDIEVTLHMQVPCPDSKRKGIFWDAPPPTMGTIRNVFIYIYVHFHISVIYNSPDGDCYWIREHPQVSSQLRNISWRWCAGIWLLQRTWFATWVGIISDCKSCHVRESLGSCGAAQWDRGH